MAEDVLHDHDGVVNDDSNCQGHGQKGEGVEGESEEVDDRYGSQQGHGDGEDDVQRAREGAEEHPTNKGREDDGEDQLHLDLVDRVFDVLGGVEVDVDGHSRRKGLLKLLERRTDGLGDRDGVGPPLLLDPQPLGGCSVDSGEAADILEAVFNEGDVFQVDRRLVDLTDHDVPESLKVDRLPQNPDVDLPSWSLQAACGKLHVLPLESRDDVADGELSLVQAGGVEPNPDVSFQPSHGDLSDSGDGLNLLLQPIPG